MKTYIRSAMATAIQQPFVQQPVKVRMALLDLRLFSAVATITVSLQSHDHNLAAWQHLTIMTWQSLTIM